MSYEVNQNVRVKQDIYEPPDEYSPGGYCAKKGDVVIVRKVTEGREWPFAVSHADRSDGNTFNVAAAEIEAITSADLLKGGAA